MQHRPFALAVEGRDGVLGVGGLTAVLAFLLGASSIGAEWSTRSLVALLFWEPRRVRVMVTKVAVVAGVAAVLGLLAEAVWLGGAVLLEALRGGPGRGRPARAVGQAAGHGRPGGAAGRARRAVRVRRGEPAAQRGGGPRRRVRLLLRRRRRAAGPAAAGAPWLLTTSAAALLDPGGVRLAQAPARGGAPYEPVGSLVTNLHGGLVLGVAAAALVGVGVLLFTRRDLG